MTAKSKHKYDVYKWIVKVIESCTTQEQLVTATSLVNNFEHLYKSSSITMVLRNHLNRSFDKITN